MRSHQQAHGQSHEELRDEKNRKTRRKAEGEDNGEHEGVRRRVSFLATTVLEFRALLMGMTILTLAICLEDLLILRISLQLQS